MAAAAVRRRRRTAGVTRTLRNALASGRLAQAFVFAGPARRRQDDDGAHPGARAELRSTGRRRIRAARATPASRSPKAATSTSSRSTPPPTPAVDNVREVIIAGLGIAPVRNRYKIFIIDEVHQLSTHSFNALLKSIEEPPPHVVFMMATTELDKIPETMLSRSQVYEFRDDQHQGDRRAAAPDRRRRGDRDRRRGAAADRARRRRQHARRAEQARSGDRVYRQDDHGRGRGDGARAGRPRPAARYWPRRSPTRTRRRRSRWPARAVEIGLRPAARLPRAVARRPRPARAVGRSRRASPIRRSPAKASAIG